MKFVFAIFRFFPHGGLQRDMLRIAEILHVRGHQVTLFCAECSGTLPEWLAVAPTAVTGWSNHRRVADFAKRFARFQETETFDRSVAFSRIPGADYYFAGDNCFAADHRKRSPFIRLLPRYRRFEKLERAIFAPPSATRILAVTSVQIADYRACYATPSERFHLLPPGISPEFRRPADPEPVRAERRRELGVTPDDILLMQVCSGFKTKGVDRALAAVAALPETIRARVRFAVVGRDPHPERFEKICRRLGIADRVVFTGARDDVPGLLLAADLMIHPARKEAGGNVLLEALVSGIPVLTGAVCGFADYVRESGGAVVAEPFFQAEFNRELTALLTAPGRLAKLKQHAIAYGAAADFRRRAEIAADLLEKEIRI